MNATTANTFKLMSLSVFQAAAKPVANDTEDNVLKLNVTPVMSTGYNVRSTVMVKQVSEGKFAIIVVRRVVFSGCRYATTNTYTHKRLFTTKASAYAVLDRVVAFNAINVNHWVES